MKFKLILICLFLLSGFLFSAISEMLSVASVKEIDIGIEKSIEKNTLSEYLTNDFVKLEDDVNALPYTEEFLKINKNFSIFELLAANMAMSHISKDFNLSKEIVFAVIRGESSGNIFAVSYMGAEGLMQLMPSTAESLGVKNSFNVYENIVGGSRYLFMQLQEFKSIELAIAAYHAGPREVIRNKRKIPPQSVEHVKKVMKYYRGYFKAYEKAKI